ncbi:LamG-like jellyroll fold domain-containing protein [Nodularia harveyana UHCC-0300]|uniref:LamG-like jellyroll fold domain-containing protein n=1 Tax=Nodularia harveyana UHCC-0300 TaxID=2974287 RepID=A0ABU5UDI6_9CYAN|nr:LamG-like jellyroll fold domain-containing protein [Nodularia harveyana]MEA5581229.1 LamG-like jellyroll fold domain-containing protein [Nodularia harveyana UHCC-0300]
MLLQKSQEIQYVNSITHAGKVVLFGTDTQGKVWYSIKQDGFEDSYLNTPPEQRTGWENWQELDFPNEVKDDASVIEKEKKEYTYQENPSEFILRSRYRTQDETAVAPVQLVSGLEYIYVLRQSKQNTLLCDRYVLDGIANKLVRKLQVRFKRSSQRFKASDKMQQTAGGLKNVDSLDYRDANGISFYEPTTELTFINNLHQGWFSVIQLPTVEHAKSRWNIFAYNSQTQKVHLYSIRVSEEGLFAVHDYNIFEPKSEDNPTLIPRSIPGIIKRTLDLNLQVGNGISATQYYVQVARETEAGQQLMRDSTKVMLGIVTTDNTVAAISFAVLGDGTLSKIQETGNPQILRSNIREVLLPLNSLDNIKSIGIAEPPPEGTITALNRTITDGIANVQVTSTETSVLKNGDELIITGTTSYDGHYTITKIDETTFEIDAPWVENGNNITEQLGTWQVVPPEEQAVTFDGLITGYEITSEGKLRVKAENHGLENGDEVQIFDTASYDGNYPITKVDEQNFTINDLRWQIGEAVSLKLQSQKRRGIVFDGVGDYISTPSSVLNNCSAFTLEGWIKPASLEGSTSLFGQNDLIEFGFTSNQLTVWTPNGGSTQTTYSYPVNEWHHIALVGDGKKLHIYIDGVEKVQGGTATSSYGTSADKFTIGAGVWSGGSKHPFIGQISDVRIWKVARTAQEIKNSMYLQLTGRELNLVGYWRLGGIAVDEDNQRKVIDFSVNGNDGIVHGNLYVGEITLRRHLADNITPTVKYTNENLIAVSQRATYIEEFEFKVNPTVDVNNADGNGNQIFRLSYWGKTSLSSQDQITIASEQDKFADLGNGWYRATSRFTIPDGVALLRTFEISDIVGNWDSLEIRKQHLRLVSNTITEASFNDSVSLASLGVQDQQNSQLIKQLASQETRQGYLIQEKLHLEAQLNALLSQGLERDTRIQGLQKAISDQQTLVNSLQNDFNYWNGEKQRADQQITLYEDTNYNDYREWSNKWTKKLDIGSYPNLGNIYAESSDDTIDIHDDIDSLKVPSGLKITLYKDSWFNGSSWTLTSNNSNLGDWRNQTSSLKIETINGNIDKNHIAQQFANKQNSLTQAQKRLSDLQAELSLLTGSNQLSQIQAIKDRLLIVNSEIKAIRDSFVSLNQGVLDAITNFTKNPFTLPQLSQDPQGLVTQGAILNFVNPVSRLHALETCEGNVQFSYFNSQGNMRNTLYDATSDSLNTTFEEWLPESLRSCLNFNNESSSVALNSPVYLKDNFTLEAWFAYPFTEQLNWRVLASSEDDQQQVVVHESTYLGLRLNDSFFDCGYDLKQLSVGWHHLTITSKYEAQTTSFYIDGEKVGTTEAKITSNIGTLGNITKRDSVSQSSTQTNTALQFDGVGEYINIGNPSVLHFSRTEPYSIETWICPEETGQRMVLLSKWNSGVGGAYNFYLSPDKKLGVNHNVSPWSVESSNPVETGKLSHVALTYDSSVVRFYINGKLAGSANFGKYLDTNTNVLIGADHNKSNPSNFFKGKITELRIWNKARTEAEIQADMNKTLTGNESGLVGYWPLRDGSAKDYSANGNNGTMYGSPQTVAFDQVEISHQSNTALQFDGVNNYIEFTQGVPSFDKAITIEFWSKGANDLQTNSIVEGLDSQNRKVFNIHLPHEQTIYWDAGNQVNCDRIQKVAQPDEYKDSWSHWAFTKDCSTGQMFIYRNGKIWHQGSGRTQPISGLQKFLIGAFYYNNKSGKWSGPLAEFRMWNKARTQAEIQADMNKTLTGNESGLVGYWPLRDGSAKDYSANGNNGTMYGSPQTVPFDQVQLPASSLTVSNPNASHFGKLAQVRLWGIGLNDQEIAVNSKTLPSGNEPGLLAYYPMNEATGNEIRDYSGNSRHGTMQRASWWGCTAPIGNLGHTAMQFDGKDDYVDCGNGINLANSSFTIEFWAKRNALGAWNIAIGQGQMVNNQGLNIGFQPDNKFTFAFYGNDLDTSTPIADFQWHHWVCSYNATTNDRIIYLDGKATIRNIASADYQGTGNLFIGRRFTDNDASSFSGQLAEVRIWNQVRTPQEIKATMHQSLTGKEAGLLGYWPLSQIQPEGATVKTPDLTGKHPGTVYEALIVKDNTLPIGEDVVVSSEYSTFDINPMTKQKSAMMRRMFAYPTDNGVKVLTDKRIETLELLWIGNAQFKPTLLGYIEGAPPVPSENMNIDGDYQYNGATSVQLTTSEDVEYSWNRSQDAGLGASVELFTGAKTTSSAGLGFVTEVGSAKIGAAGNLDMSYQWFNESNVSSSSSLVTTDSLELRGAPEVTAQFPHYGNRFIPKNVGYALVVSSLADVFISRLSRSQKMVGYEVRPVEDIPPDINTITFLINPAYVMNGSLDGLVGSSAANDKFYGHVPEMRSQYGSLYPASYFRLMEAYNLKQQIEKADKERQSYFINFNSNLVDEGSLSRQAKDGSAVQTVTLNQGAENIDISGNESTEDKQAQLDQLKSEGGAKLEDLKNQGNQRKQEISSRIDDIEKRTHAVESFAGWQKNMENILIRSGKRNIVNTYVWDADGGLRVEEQSFANTTEHTIGGSFSMSGSLGAKMNLSVFGVGVELTAMATTNLTQTMTKTQANSKGMELNVDLSGIEMLGITDENDIPFQPGEKVDRFRMMSFYLEGSTDNYLDFFNYVVDPEWLASNDEEARALRQVQTGRPNKAWRVLHRVTYVERPSLMGFGRDMRSQAEIASFSQARMSWLIPANATVLDEVKTVRNRVEYLEQENAKLQAKLDQIINLLNNP